AAPAVGRIDLDPAREGAVEVPRTARRDVLVQRVRAVLRQDHHVGDPGVHAVRQREVDDPVLAGEGYGRLGALLRQNAEPRALAAGEDDGTRPHGRTPRRAPARASTVSPYAARPLARTTPRTPPPIWTMRSPATCRCAEAMSIWRAERTP